MQHAHTVAGGVQRSAGIGHTVRATHELLDEAINLARGLAGTLVMADPSRWAVAVALTSARALVCNLDTGATSFAGVGVGLAVHATHGVEDLGTEAELTALLHARGKLGFGALRAGQRVIALLDTAPQELPGVELAALLTGRLRLALLLHTDPEHRTRALGAGDTRVTLFNAVPPKGPGMASSAPLAVGIALAVLLAAGNKDRARPLGADLGILTTLDTALEALLGLLAAAVLTARTQLTDRWSESRDYGLGAAVRGKKIAKID